MTDIKSKDELIEVLKESSQRAETWFHGIPASEFFTRQGEAWSPSDNLDHLIKAVKPVARALRMPKITLQAMFGKAEKASMSYEQLCLVYRQAIAQGGQASGRYLPNQQSPVEEAQEQKTSLLVEWSRAGAELVSVAKTWEEKDLDQYLISHPLLGKLTVREMLYFTIYHTLRHASQEGD